MNILLITYGRYIQLCYKEEYYYVYVGTYVMGATRIVITHYRLHYYIVVYDVADR